MDLSSASSTSYFSTPHQSGIFLDVSSDLAELMNVTIGIIRRDLGTDFELLPYTRKINASSFYSFKTEVCEVFSEGVFMTIASEKSSTEYSIMPIMEALHMPYITFSGQDLQADEWNYKLRMTPSYAAALAALEVYYNWQHVFYLYSDEAGLARFEQLAEIRQPNQQPIEIDLRYLNPSLADSYDVLRYLDRKYVRCMANKTEMVIILDLPSDDLTQTVLDQLADLGMIRENYHIVPATLAITNLNLQRLHVGGATVTGFKLFGLNSSDVYKELALDSLELVTRALKNIPEKRELFKGYYRTGVMYNGDIIGISCYTRDNPLGIGSNLMDSLKKTRFTGRTGKVKFDDQGYRTDYELDIYQQTPSKTLSQVAKWSTISGLHENVDMRPPKDAELPETGFFNETFIVTTVLVQPYAMEKADKSGPGDEKYEGYAIDLVARLAKTVGFNYVIKPVKDHGNLQADGNWSGMIGELIAKRADLAVADLTITSERERVVEFSAPFMNLGISIMIKKPEKQKPSVYSFMEPLSGSVWMCIALSFTGVTLVIYVISRISPNEWKVEEQPNGDESVENQFTLQNSAWFAAGALMCQGSEHSPYAPSNRVVGSAWWLFTLIIISSYTANLAAFLTVENIFMPVKNVQDLAQKWPDIKYGTLNSGTTRGFFENSNDPLFQEMWKNMASQPEEFLLPDAASGIDKVQNSKGQFAFLFESTTNEFANQRKPCNTMKVGENLDSKNYGIAMQRGHKLRHQVTLAILKMLESGELTKLEQTWWYDKGQCTNDEGKSAMKAALSLSNVAGVFYILIGGLLIAMFCALLEFVVKSVQDAKRFKKSFREAMKSKARLSIAGESDDSPSIGLHSVARAPLGGRACLCLLQAPSCNCGD
ncbi:glutamate receptor 4-like [Watersipora subatra]|uniref:glutamate receptor 4-like n=1 Tax=Watersipora subatra TaxID=2589382 RepID=UPI00355AE143